MKTGIELITEERKEQLQKHVITLDEDIEFNDQNQLAVAASCLCNTSNDESIKIEAPIGWDKEGFEYMMNKSYKEKLIIAGALIAAEIDGLQTK